MSEMIQVVIDSIRVHLMTPQRVVVLKQVQSERYLAIWVGPYEAEAITVALQEVEMSRPLTHDLLKNVFAAFHASIRRVEIVSVHDNTFYGNIVAEVNGVELNIDSRPSDAIALAVRTHVPILVAPEVMESAGQYPEADLPEAAVPPSRKEAAASAPEEGSDRLSVFKNFLDQLDLDEPGEGEDQDPNIPPF